MIKKLLSLSLILQIFSVQAESTSSIGADTVLLGKPGSSSAVKIKSRDGGYLKKEVGGPWLYSNDGALEKKMGSGSGAGGSTGVNLLTNDSLEDGISSPWTSTGGTFSQQTYSVGSESDTKYGRFISTTSGQHVEQIVSVPTNFGAGCQADFKKVNIATAGLFKVQALDVSNNILAEQTIGASSWIKVPTISFPCPASGTNNLKLRLISLAAGTIDFDKGYIGSNQNVTSGATIIKQDVIRLDGFSSYSGGNYKFTTVTTNTANYINADNSGAFTKIVALKPVFGLKLTFTSAHNVAQNAVNNITRYTAGGSVIESWQGQQSVASSSVGGGTLTINTDMNVGDYLALGDQNGAATVTGASVLARLDSVIQSEAGVSPEQSSWYIDASIGGSGTTIGSVTSTSYVPFDNGNLDLILNPGSALATIPCAGTNPDTGLTCAVGNENVGVSFTPPNPGVYEACIYTFITNAAGSATSTNQWVETPTNAQTILQEGKTKIGFTGSAGTATAITNCGLFTFNDISKRTLRFSYESNSAALTMPVDRDAALGQREARIIVRPFLSAFNRPFLTGDQVIAKGTKNPVIFYSLYNGGTPTTTCTTSSCTTTDLHNQDWINGNVIRATTGDYSFVSNSVFSPNSYVYCSASSQQSAGASGDGGNVALLVANGSGVISSTNFPRSWNSIGTAADTFGIIKCEGISN